MKSLSTSGEEVHKKEDARCLLEIFYLQCFRNIEPVLTLVKLLNVKFYYTSDTKSKLVRISRVETPKGHACSEIIIATFLFDQASVGNRYFRSADAN